MNDNSSLNPDNSYVDKNTNVLEVQRKIQNLDKIEDLDLETSLSIAAEAGNALLIENDKLKLEISKSNQDTKELQNYIKTLENHTSYASELEEQLTSAEEATVALTRQNYDLENELSVTKRKLKEETTLKEELILQSDSEKGYLNNIIKEVKAESKERISEADQEITSLRTKIEELESELIAAHSTTIKIKSDLEAFSKELLKNEEQTKLFLTKFLSKIADHTFNPNHKSSVYKVDETLNNQLITDNQNLTSFPSRPSISLQDELHYMTQHGTTQESSLTPGTSQTCSKKLNSNFTNTKTLTITPLTPGSSQTCSKKLNSNLTNPKTLTTTPLTPGSSQTCSKKLNSSMTHPKTITITPLTPGTSQTCSKKLSTSTVRPKTLTTRQTPNQLRKSTNGNIKRKNIFSISLQAAKYARQKDGNEQRNDKPKSTVTKKPPSTAIIRPHNEDVEDFFNKHINFYKQLNYNEKTNLIFLGDPHKLIRNIK